MGKVFNFIRRGSRVRKEGEAEDTRKRELFMGTISEKVGNSGLKKKDEEFDLERTHSPLTMERSEEYEKEWSIEAREVILFFALKGEGILFVEKKGWA